MEISPLQAIHLPTRLANLAMALHRRYGTRKDPADLQEALGAAEDAVRATPLRDIERSRRLSARATLLRSRYKAYQDPSDLGLILDLGESALRASSAEHAHRAELFNSCAQNMVFVAEAWAASTPPPDAEQAAPATRSIELIQHALDLYDHARSQTTARIHDRAEAARSWAALTAVLDPASAIEGARTAFELFSTVDWHGMRIADRVSILGNWAGFPSRAASWALNLRQYAEAVQLLEQGRGQLWAQITDSHTPLSSEAPGSLELAERLNAINASLNELTRAAARPAGQAAASGKGIRGEQLGRLNAERRSVLTRLSALEGRSPTPAVPEVKAIAGGSAVLVNISSQRCDALVLHTSDDGTGTDIEPVHLTAVTMEETEDKVRAFARAIATARTAHRRLLADRCAERPSSRTTRAAFHSSVDELGDLLAWGWESITGPVLEAIERVRPADGTTQVRRIWWGATGPLTPFPLHATGYHDGSGRAVMDRFASSEMVTLRALSQAGGRPAPAGPARLLSVGVPRPRGLNRTLAAVSDEVAAVVEQSPIPATPLNDESATRDRILAELPGHTWFHYAGHGTTGISDPSDAALSAFDAPVTLADLATAMRTDAELAFLSSCHGATPSPDQPDEALHLAAAFHSAGFRHIIAARHAVDDLTAERIATGFYQELRHIRDPGLALHRTLFTLRARLAQEKLQDDLVYPFAWISHTHLGPAGPVLPPAC